MVDVVEVRWIRNHVLWLRFEDGVSGEVDLWQELDGPIFEPLRDLSYFGTVSVNPELGTICWGNGADFAPEYLHSRMHAVA